MDKYLYITESEITRAREELNERRKIVEKYNSHPLYYNYNLPAGIMVTVYKSLQAAILFSNEKLYKVVPTNSYKAEIENDNSSYENLDKENVLNLFTTQLSSDLFNYKDEVTKEEIESAMKFEPEEGDCLGLLLKSAIESVFLDEDLDCYTVGDISSIDLILKSPNTNQKALLDIVDTCHFDYYIQLLKHPNCDTEIANLILEDLEEKDILNDKECNYWDMALLAASKGNNEFYIDYVRESAKKVLDKIDPLDLMRYKISSEAATKSTLDLLETFSKFPKFTF